MTNQDDISGTELFVANQVLILDDDVGLARTLVRAAKMIGFDAEFFTTGPKLFGRLDEHADPVILCLDLNLQETDAAEVMASLSEMKFDGTILLLSGAGERVIEATSRIGEGYGFRVAAGLCKPCSINQFQEALLQCSMTKPGVETPDEREARQTGTPCDIQRIIERGSWELCFQPIMHAATGRVKGFEALSRIKDWRGDSVPPQQFFEDLESTEFVFDRTEDVIATATSWLQENVKDATVGISINVSAKFICTENSVEIVKEHLERSGIAPDRVTLEITEGSKLVATRKSLEQLTRMRILGINLSMDDFGIGYSGLQSLSDFPFSELKIDKEFVLSMEKRPAAKEIIRSAIGFARRLEMDLCAEGVETQEIAEQLISMGATTLQGYYFAEPMLSDDAKSWLEAKSGVPSQTEVGQFDETCVGEASDTGPLVAIVDDEVGVRRTLVQGLKGYGFACRPYCSGEDFLASLDSEIPECVILDLRMPGDDGLEVLRKIPDSARHIPILIFTSHAEVKVAVETLKTGAFDFLEKPLPIKELAKRVEIALEASQSGKAEAQVGARSDESFATLTERQKTIAHQIFIGNSNKEIAYNLNLSPRTVEHHRAGLMKKLNCRNLSQLMTFLATVSEL